MGQTWCGGNKQNNIDEKIIEILFKNEVLFNEDMPLFIPRWKYGTIAEEIGDEIIKCKIQCDKCKG
jgi:hypothetical protein|tara:strand:- start:119 stop:316 length:198 start_codon:yes stop_codon:yes gene_type:complete